MDRTKFYNIAEIDDVKELDYLDNNVSKFTTKYAVGYYTVKEDDLMRPDLISYKVYRTVEFWWIIAVYNNIADVFNDFYVGQILKIPNLLDIYEFRKKYVVR